MTGQFVKSAQPPVKRSVVQRWAAPEVSMLTLARFIAIAALVVSCAASHANAQSSCDSIQDNLVANCGFETGDFTSWQVNDAISGSFLSVEPGIQNSGNYAAIFAGTSPGNYDQIQQTLATTAQHFYDVSFYLQPGGDGSPSDFQALWNGSAFFDLSNVTGFGPYQQYFFDLAGTGSDVLSFQGYNTSFGFSLDDVSVTDIGAVPEPASGVLIIVGLIVTRAMFRLRIN